MTVPPFGVFEDKIVGLIKFKQALNFPLQKIQFNFENQSLQKPLFYYKAYPSPQECDLHYE